MASVPTAQHLDGVADLSGACTGSLGILVAEGPSLAQALPALADPGPRSKYIMVCTTGALRSLVAAGIAPDAVVLGVEEPDLEAILGQLPGRLQYHALCSRSVGVRGVALVEWTDAPHW